MTDTLVPTADIASAIANDITSLKALDPTAAASKYKPLLDPLSTFAIDDPNAAVSWSISTPPMAQGQGYGLDLGATATLSFNAGGKWPDANPATKLLTIGADGKVDAGASGKLPIPYGTVTAGASASAHLTLTYFFEAQDQNQVYALAVAERLSALVDPFDFTAVWTGFQDADIAGLIYEFDGAAKASLQVAVGDALALGAGNVVVAELGATVGVSANLTTAYTLKLQRVANAGGGAAVHVQLSRNPVSTEQLNTSLGLDVDLSALTKPVVGAIDTAIGQWDATLSQIKPFLSPGTWLRSNADAALSQQLTQMISDSDLRSALISDMHGALGVQDVTDPSLVGWLSDQIYAAIDRGSALVDGQIDAAAKRVMANLAAAAPTLSQAAADQLTTLVTNDITTVDTALKTAVQGLLAGPAGALQTALKAAGAQVANVVATLDDAMSGVRSLLQNVDSKFHQYLDAATKALKQKITARLYADETTTSGATVEVDGVFTASGDNSAKVFEALILGDFPTLVNVVEGKLTTPNFTLDAANSSITRFSKTKSDQGVEIAFLNFFVTGSEVISADATTVVDGSGNMHVYSDADMSKTFANPFNTRQASFVDTHSLVQAGAMHAAATAGVPVLELGVGASFSANALELNDVQNFMKGFADAGLISAGASNEAGAVFNTWRQAAGADGKAASSISASLRLAGAQIESLLQLADRTPTGLSTRAQQLIVQTGYDALIRAKAINESDFMDGLNIAIGLFDPPAPVGSEIAVADVVLNYSTRIPRFSLPAGDGRPSPEDGLQTPFAPGQEQDQATYIEFLGNAYDLNQLMSLIDTMGDIYQSKASPAPGQPGWQEQQYQNAQQKMVADSESWVTVFSSLAGLFSSSPTPHTIALMRAMMDLTAPGAQPGGVAVTLNGQTAGAPRTAAFK